MGVIMKNKIPYGGGGGDNSKELTYEEYQALSEEERKNGTTYYVSDVESADISTIIDTMEEIEANTEENKIAGALAVKELSAYIQKNLAYKDISDKFTTDESIIKLNAYVENGMVLISTRVQAGVTGIVTVQLNDLTYAPRVIAGGVYACMGSAGDKGKFVGANISNTGVLTIYLAEALYTTENVIFTYPLKTE